MRPKYREPQKFFYKITVDLNHNSYHNLFNLIQRKKLAKSSSHFLTHFNAVFHFSRRVSQGKMKDYERKLFRNNHTIQGLKKNLIKIFLANGHPPKFKFFSQAFIDINFFQISFLKKPRSI